MSETTTKTQSETAEESGPALTSYRVGWVQKGTDKSHTDTCIVDSDDMTRPGDPEQLHALLRKMLAIRHLPIGQTVPDNIVLEVVDPICNCEPFPGDNCTYANYRGERFHLTPSEAFPQMEVIRDRHRDKVVAVVSISESVEVLTLVRKKYGHQ